MKWIKRLLGIKQKRTNADMLLSTMEAMAFCAAYGTDHDRRLVRLTYERLERETINGRLQQQEGLMLALKRSMVQRMKSRGDASGE